MNSEQVKQLQIQLNNKGANLKVDGILGPKTISAMNQFSAPTTGGMTTAQINQLQTSLGIPVTGVLDATTTTAMNKAVASSLASNPEAAHLVAQNSPDAIINAYATGDWSTVNDITGKPFSVQQQQNAVAKATEALTPGFQAADAFNKANVESSLGATQDNYNNFLKSEARDFSTQKQTLDKNAADNGVLFAGSRIQKQNNLQNIFDERLRQQQAQTGQNIGNTARQYQYQYGNDAAQGLSKYYNLPGQKYNAGVASGTTTPSNLSSIYNTGNYNFQGTVPVSNQTAIQTRAAGLLANKANKLVPYGYKTQL